MDQEHYIDDLQARRIAQELEHAIREINKHHIGEITGPVSRQAFLNVADKAARLRAHYLAKALELGAHEGVSGEELKKMKEVRVGYEEAVAGFQALQHALTRGYLHLIDDD